MSRALSRVSDALRAAGATVDEGARPGFDPMVSHKVYLQLLGAMQSMRLPAQAAAECEAANAAEAEAVGALRGRLWEASDADFIIRHSLTQSFRSHVASQV